MATTTSSTTSSSTSTTMSSTSTFSTTSSSTTTSTSTVSSTSTYSTTSSTSSTVSSTSTTSSSTSTTTTLPFSDARITHAVVEVIRDGDPNVRITHSVVEVLRDNTTTTSTTTSSSTSSTTASSTSTHSTSTSTFSTTTTTTPPLEPTILGNKTVGSSSQNAAARVIKVTATEDGLLYNIVIYSSFAKTSDLFCGVVYSDNAGEPGSLLWESNHTYHYSGPAKYSSETPLEITSGTTYWIGYWRLSGDILGARYDAGTGESRYLASVSGDPASSWDTGSDVSESSIDYTIYAEYGPGYDTLGHVHLSSTDNHYGSTLVVLSKFTLSSATTFRIGFARLETTLYSETQMVVYDDSEGTPNNLIAASGETTSIAHSQRFVMYDFFEYTNLSAGDYWIGFHFNQYKYPGLDLSGGSYGYAPDGWSNGAEDPCVSLSYDTGTVAAFLVVTSELATTTSTTASTTSSSTSTYSTTSSSSSTASSTSTHSTTSSTASSSSTSSTASSTSSTSSTASSSSTSSTASTTSSSSTTTTTPPEYWHTDFREQEVDQVPDGWTEQWHPTSGESTIRDDGQIGNNCLEIVCTDERYGFSWDQVGQQDDAEILVKVRSRENIDLVGYTILRGGGTGDGGETAYYACLYPSSDRIYIRKYVSGSSLPISYYDMTIDTDTWYWMRFRVLGNDLKLRVWEDGDAEPGTWQLEVTDTDIVGTGWVGVGTFYDGPDYDYVSVASNGGTALLPSLTTTTTSSSTTTSSTHTYTGSTTTMSSTSSSSSTASSTSSTSSTASTTSTVSTTTSSSSSTTTTFPPCFWSDDFTQDDGVPNKLKWTDDSSGVGYITVDTNRLRIVNGGGGTNTGIATCNATFSGDFEVEVDLEAVLAPFENSWSARLQALIDSSNYIWIDMHFEEATDSWSVGYRKAAPEKFADSDARTNDSGSLRIIRTGSTFYTYYKDGSGAWTELNAGGQNIGSGNVTISFQCVSWEFAANFEVAWDNFLVDYNGCPESVTTTTSSSSTTSSTTVTGSTTSSTASTTSSTASTTSTFSTTSSTASSTSTFSTTSSTASTSSTYSTTSSTVTFSGTTTTAPPPPDVQTTTKVVVTTG